MYRTPLCLGLFLALGLVLAGCSDDQESTEHVWKDQVETIDKAREVEDTLKDAADQRKKAAEDSGY